ncbi:hypothetical protein AK812_SmicGene2964 [Symbiodinium microadriaticum]|uniref:Uncharacterized protein n=1 Tax=Symbiodinium microadriaticum TaxID=2951 RepID=A0A1Q9F0I1_SYMMI|nr:hypothetical protein AK812_SmicGene2964 [Symbiodinium microadriaticum]
MTALLRSSSAAVDLQGQGVRPEVSNQSHRGSWYGEEGVEARPRQGIRRSSGLLWRAMQHQPRQTGGTWRPVERHDTVGRLLAGHMH